MAEEAEEQNKSEEATPFKLERARRRGMLARGTDLGFFVGLLSVAIAAQLSGTVVIGRLAETMRQALASTSSAPHETLPTLIRGWAGSIAVAAALVLPVVLVVAIAVTAEIVQNRGLVFTAAPLKPDFTRLNPAKGLKRLFSLRMLKELGKNVLKIAIYGGGAHLLISNVANEAGYRARNGRQLAELLSDSAARLLLMFLFLAAAFALLDQLIARREFGRQMRMSRREMTREVREREGEPRQKQKRRQMLTEIIKQAAASTNVKGADVLIVNPVHFAIALRYRPEESDAPVIQAMGRNLWAQRMRTSAQRESIVIVRNPALAQALYRQSRVGQRIGAEHFVAVADIYIMLRRALSEGAGN